MVTLILNRGYLPVLPHSLYRAVVLHGRNQLSQSVAREYNEKRCRLVALFEGLERELDFCRRTRKKRYL